MVDYRSLLSRILILAVMVSFVGCGSSEKDRLQRMMAAKAKNRKQDESDADEGGRPKEKKKTVDEKDKEPQKKAGDGDVVPQKNTSGPEDRILKSADSNDPSFIAFRKNLLEKFDERGRNMTHIEKLERVAKALADKIRGERTLPSNGIPPKKPALSWRVSILPFLGYQELYDQFDPNRRFNSPVNKRLIDLMPPEFQTCSEKGKTNFVLPIASYTPFSPVGNGLSINRVEDGLADTVIVLEVDDQDAQVWTAPEAFKLNIEDPRKGVGEKYGFMPLVFGDGRVEKARKGISKEHFRALVSHDAGDSYPLNTTEELAQADFGLHGFGPKQQLVMSGARGAVSLVGRLREGALANTDTPNSGDSESSANKSNSSTAQASLANKLRDGANRALQQSDLSAAFDYEFASLIVADESRFKGYGWCKALQRPVLAARWSIGVLYNENVESFDPPKRAKERAQSADLPGEELLESKTGQIGLDAMIVLRNLVNEQKFGPILLDQVAVVNANLNTSRLGKRNRNANRVDKSSNQTLFNSQRIPELHFPGIEVDQGNSRSYHVKVAKDRGNELLLLFDIDVRMFGKDKEKKTMQITTLYVIDVARGKELWRSAPLNSYKIEEERKDASKKDAVFVELTKLDKFCREEVALAELPQSLSREHVLKRLKVLAAKSNPNKLSILAEGKFYLSKNLILQTDYTQFCIDVLEDQEKGLQLAVGDDSQKLENLKKYLPLHYSIELSK